MPKGKQGFASMDRKRARELQSKGGKSQRPDQRTFYKDRELARRAGEKGGRVTSLIGAPRPFEDRELAKAAHLKSSSPVGRQNSRSKSENEKTMSDLERFLKKRGEKACATCVHLYVQLSPENPLQKLMICKEGPPPVVAIMQPQGIILVTSFRQVTAEEFCDRWVRDPLTEN